MAKPAKFVDFFKYANFFFTSMGMQPYEGFESSKSYFWLYLFVFLVEAITLDIMLLGEISFVVLAVKNGNHFIEATMVMSYVGFNLVVNSKLFFVWKKKATLTRFVNGLKLLFPQTLELQRKYFLQKYLGQCTRLTMIFSLLYMILIWTYNLMGIVQHLFFGAEQTLPFLIHTPWVWKDNWSYYVLYLFQILAGYTSAAGQIAGDLFLVSCATQLIMHFDYVYYSLAFYPGSESGGVKGKEEDMKFIKEMAAYHANLMEISELINDIFGLPLLLNFMTSSVVICFIGFQMTIGVTPATVVKLILFLSSSLAQVYVICNYSQILIDVSTNVARAVYEQNWTQTDVEFQKMLVLIAHRAQKPMQLKATTFVNISRDTMSEIINRSYSFFTLLRTMYSE